MALLGDGSGIAEEEGGGSEGCVRSAKDNETPQTPAAVSGAG